LGGKRGREGEGEGAGEGGGGGGELTPHLQRGSSSNLFNNASGSSAAAGECATAASHSSTARAPRRRKALRAALGIFNARVASSRKWSHPERN
jgi:hypothetical protein